MDTVEAGNVSIRKLAEPLGAEITGVDVGQPMSHAAFRRVEDAFNEHCVLVFRNQRLTPEGHAGFSRRFGDLLVHVLRQYNDPQMPRGAGALQYRRERQAHRHPGCRPVLAHRSLVHR